MNENKILCLCGEKFDEKSLKIHIRMCEPFIDKFKLFDYKISRLLNEYVMDKQHCFLVRFMFKRYIKKIEHKIREDQTQNENHFDKPPKNEIIKQKSMINTFNNLLNKISNNKSVFHFKNDNKQNNTINHDIKDIDDYHEIKKIKTKDDNNKFGIKKIFPFFNYKICRFCGNKIEKNSECENYRCVENSKIACDNKLSCKHNCLGIFNALICLPCLNKNCKNYGGFFEQNQDSPCQICQEKLSSSPIVSLSCNHYFHYLCIKKKLEDKQNLSGDISNFNFLKCPRCDSIYECPSVPQFQKKIEEYKILYIKVKKKIEQRISYQKYDIKHNTDPFDLFLFFLCYKCHEPYYAGYKNKNIIINTENKEQCLCGKDSFLKYAKGESKCEKHGLEFIEYKCKFCCNIASRFICNTHLCEECYANKNTIKKSCNSVKCDFRGSHAPNGIEYCLGCFICRYNTLKNNSQNFDNIA